MQGVVWISTEQGTSVASWLLSSSSTSCPVSISFFNSDFLALPSHKSHRIAEHQSRSCLTISHLLAGLLKAPLAVIGPMIVQLSSYDHTHHISTFQTQIIHKMSLSRYALYFNRSQFTSKSLHTQFVVFGLLLPSGKLNVILMSSIKTYHCLRA